MDVPNPRISATDTATPATLSPMLPDTVGDDAVTVTDPVAAHATPGISHASETANTTPTERIPCISTLPIQ
jgi:hypothetical protein